LEATRCGGCGRSALDIDRLLVINGTSSANRVAIIINNTPANKYSEHYYGHRCSEYSTMRHRVAIHFHRLPHLQQLSTRA
jgi:hypothetical protein